MKRHDSMASKVSCETMKTSNITGRNESEISPPSESLSLTNVSDEVHSHSDSMEKLPSVSVSPGPDYESADTQSSSESEELEDITLDELKVRDFGSGMEISLQRIRSNVSAKDEVINQTKVYVTPEKMNSDDTLSASSTPHASCSYLLSLDVLSGLLKRKQEAGKNDTKKVNNSTDRSGSNCVPDSSSPHLSLSCDDKKVDEDLPKQNMFHCGVPNCCDDDNTALDPEAAVRRRSMEISIRALLGTSTDKSRCTKICCDSWQLWSLSCDNTNLSPDINSEQVVKVLRNRAGNLNSQARRRRLLQNNIMHLERRLDQNASMPTKLVKANKSFDERSRYKFLDGFVSTKTGTPPSSVAGTSTSVSTVFETINLEQNNFSSYNDEIDHYYDSDPGLIKPRDVKQLRVTMDSVERLEKNQTLSSVVPFGMEKSLEQIEKFDFDVENLMQVQTLLKETLNKCFILIWHPVVSTKIKSYSPIRVKAWIELGTQLRSRLIQPKFVWKVLTENELECTKSSVSNVGLKKLELLDIIRVLDDQVDRSKYPFAKRSCSFTTETSSEKYLFEATNNLERDKIVTGLKLAIARLGSKIVMQDESVLGEFFSPFGDVDPTLPPQIFQSSY